MSSFIVRRLTFLVITLLISSMIIFVVVQLLPGDVARVMLGREASPEAVAALRTKMGLDDPVPMRYVRWLSGFVRGDWGSTYPDNSPVYPLVTQRLVKSMWLAVATLVLAVPLSIALGVLAGLNANKPIDAVTSIGTLALVGLPEFVTGIALISVFSYQLHWLPANSSISPDTSLPEAIPSLILPAITATLVLMAYIIRLTRAGVIEVLRRPYVRTAMLKGLPWRRVVFTHILRNALLPTVTAIAISTGWLISGLVVIENVFGYPGLGKLMIFAIGRRDLQLMQAIAMITVLFYMLANLTADLLYAYLNPRIRFE